MDEAYRVKMTHSIATFDTEENASLATMVVAYNEDGEHQSVVVKLHGMADWAWGPEGETTIAVSLEPEHAARVMRDMAKNLWKLAETLSGEAHPFYDEDGAILHEVKPDREVN